MALRGQETENSQEALRVLHIILRQNAAKQGCLLVHQSFFHNSPGNFMEVGGGVLGCRGFHSSFRATHGGLSLNIDVSTTMIIKPAPVMEFLMENQGVRNRAGIDWGKAKRTLKNLRITARPGNAEHKITGLSEHAISRCMCLRILNSQENMTTEELPPQVRNPPVSQDRDSMKFLDETKSDCSDLEEE